MHTTQALFTVVRTADPETVHEFGRDEERLVFGRDPAQCDLIVPVAPGDRDLSRVAGLIWRMDGELWVRNLSARHELRVQVLGMPPEQPLPPRRPDGYDKGHARSLPIGLTYLRAPGGCELLVRQLPAAPDVVPVDESTDATTRAPDLPDELRPVAVALCAPLLQGSQLPATYAQVGERLGIPQTKVLRNLVDKVSRLYADAVPELRERMERRREAEADALGLTGARRLVNGVWRFDRDEEPGELSRRRALALPDYFEVAHLLVRRGLVNATDLLQPTPADPGRRA